MVIKKQDAFTLMEILIVVVVIGILATLLGPRIAGAWKTIKINQTKTILAQVKAGIGNYYGDVGSFPKQLDDLLDPPSDSKRAARWKGPYVKGKNLPEDGWGNAFEYNSPPVRFGKEFRYQDYEIISLGPDGRESEDDMHDGE
jgi:general secretion pathway protein G